MMPYCKNCGFKLLEEVNFCPNCGQQLKQVTPAAEIVPPEEQIPVANSRKTVYMQDQTFTLLEEGSVFDTHYSIGKVLGRDNESITYQATDLRYGERRSLKLFHRAYFDCVEKLFGTISRLAKIKTIEHANFARVYEVNQSHKPVYIVSDYIEGKSLATIKETNPDSLKEEKCRLISRQVVEAAIAISNAGLSVSDISLNSVILTDDDRAIVLPASVSFEESDVREDIFFMGVFFAQLFSTSSFYSMLYTPSKMGGRKFEYIPGVTHGTNDIIARCLQRNAAARYSSFEGLKKDLTLLKPIQEDEIVTSSEGNFQLYRDRRDAPVLDRKFDIYFVAAIVLILVFIAVLMTTNLLDTVFGRDETLRITGLSVELPDTAFVAPVTDDSYRKIVPINPIVRRSPRREVPAQNTNPNTQTTSPATSNRQTGTNQSSNQPQPTNDKLVFIFGDTFAFGSLKQGAKSNVSLPGFYISRTEVTQAEWNKYMNPAKFSLAGDNLPVDNISWFDAVIYCNKRSEAEGLTPVYKFFGTSVSPVVTCNFKANGYRLPTEAEWEYAARAKKLTVYSGSDTPEQVAWFKDNSVRRIQPVRSKSPNFFGLHDMTGNVSEWCWNWYDANYPKIMPFINPTGPESGTTKVVRGGNVETAGDNSLEVTFRSKALPGIHHRYIGFRVVRSR